MNQDPAFQILLLKIIGAGVVGIDALLIGLVVWRRYRGKATFSPQWSVIDLWFVVQIVAVFVVALLIPLTFAAMMAGVSLTELTTLSSKKAVLYLVLPSAIVQNIPFFVIPAGWIVLRYRLSLREIGLPPLPRRRDWCAGIALGVIGMALSGAIGAGVEALAEHFHSVAWVQAEIAIDKNNPVANMESVLPHTGIFGAILAVVAVGVAAPFGEEMFFRGFAFNALRKRFGVGVGVALSALLFTLPHTYGLGLVPVFAIGALMAWCYNNTGSLWVTIILHATNNTAQVLLAFLLPAGHR